MKRILITGGAGYIGSLLSDTLVNQGYEVTVIDNLFFNKNTIGHLIIKKNFKFIHADVRNSIITNEEIKKNDIIIPLACLVGAPLCDKYPNDALEINQDVIVDMINKKSKNQIILYPNTNSGYGTTKKNVECDEKMDLNPISVYGKTKCMVENKLMEKENVVSFRLATVFGSSFRNRIDLLVNYFVYNAIMNNKLVLFEPKFRRNYIHIRDIVNTFIFTIENFQKLKNNIFNVGLSSANLTKIDLCNKIKKYITSFRFEVSEEGTDPDKRDYFVSNKKIESMGWKPKVTLDEGIIELSQVYRLINNSDFDKNI
tara:strand:- start:16953 stop:17891 length:939 start_codon:yes stop_codon:yes gene_type:complete